MGQLSTHDVRPSGAQKRPVLLPQMDLQYYLQREQSPTTLGSLQVINVTNHGLGVIPRDSGFSLVKEDLASRLHGVGLLVITEPPLNRSDDRPKAYDWN